jgi:hypothetical protein
MQDGVRLSIDERRMIAASIKTAIDDHSVARFNEGHRTHLGASIIGHECERHLWYTFRWCYSEQISGRTYRLFNRGHREEPALIALLEGVGFKVEAHTVDGEQIRIANASGHFGGSLDGKADVPDWLKAAYPKLVALQSFLLEFKTSGTGRPFSDLAEKGVRSAKPRHFAQMSVYGKAYDIAYALYICVNKNDDDLYIELVELDKVLAETLQRRAERVIGATAPPAKINQSPAWFTCKWCFAVGGCHDDQKTEVNCRSCKFASAVEGKAWLCGKFGQTIPPDFIPKGCAEWQDITK